MFKTRLLKFQLKAIYRIAFFLIRGKRGTLRGKENRIGNEFINYNIALTYFRK